MAQEYEEAQRLIHKIKSEIKSLALNNPDQTLIQASTALDLQTLQRCITSYKQFIWNEKNPKKSAKMTEEADKMTDIHEELINEFRLVKNRNMTRATVVNDRNELFQRGDKRRNKYESTIPMGFDTNSSGNYGLDREADFMQSSEIEIDGFIGQGVAALENLRQQRGLLQRSRGKVQNSRGVLGLSGKVIDYINRRNAQDKAILIGGMIITTICIYLVIKYLG